ncbi:MAG TPA: RodZ domain-containing protein [Terriglobales bacterium]|nr:RodZ domain-containing protein [Terriglobales bacterium]
MGSFGDRLHRERELRGITLEEIAEATKIGTRSLRALEEQDFDKLPGGIFNRGFVRAYARYLGLDEDQAVADYQTAINEAAAAGNLSRQEPAVPPPTVGEPIAEAEQREPLHLPLGAILTFMLIVALLIAGWRYYAKYGVPKVGPVRAAGQQHPPAPRSSGTRYAADAVEPAKADMAQAAKAEAAQPVQATDLQASSAHAVQPLTATTASSSLNAREFVIRVKAKENSWLSVVADGKQVMSGELAADSERSFHAHRDVVLKTGNAAGIELFHNDKLLPRLGENGQVKTVEFTPTGVRR